MLQKLPPEVFCKKVFKGIKNLGENTYVGVYFLRQGCFLWILQNF